jgi:hypothetical protein
MFSRQLIDIWASLLKNHRGMAVSDFPALMNAPLRGGSGSEMGTSDLRYAFEAAFVGDAREFGSRAVESFFPLGWPAGSTAPIPESNLTCGDVIPNARIGDLYDDLVTFWANSRDTPDVKYLFVEIKRATLFGQGAWFQTSDLSPHFLTLIG